MESISERFNAVFRDFFSDGIASSGRRQPDKAELRGLGLLIEAKIAAAIAAGADPLAVEALISPLLTSALTSQQLANGSLIQLDGALRNLDASLSEITTGAVQSATSGAVQAKVAAELARDQAADLVLPENLFLDVSLGTAEAAVATGIVFKLTSSSTGMTEVRKRTVGGSDLLYTEATTAALGSSSDGMGLSLSKARSGSTGQQEIDARSILAFSPQSIRAYPGSATASAMRAAVQDLIDDYAPTSQMIALPAVGENYQINLPVLLKSGTSLLVYGLLENVNTSGSSYQQPAFYAGCFNQAMTSPLWLPPSGTNRCVPLYNGSFNAAGEFELNGTVDAGAGVTPASSAAWFASKSVGDLVLFVSSAGYQFSIGEGGVGGTGINRECIEIYRISAKTPGSPNKLSFDKAPPVEHSVGAVCDGQSADIVDDATVGSTYEVLDAVRIEGPGGCKTAGVGMFRTACRNFYMNVSFLQQKYGLGGNLMVDCYQYAETIIANDKAWDIAAASRRSRYGFGSMLVLGDGTDAAGKGVFGENSRWCHVSGRRLAMPNMTGDNAVAFNVASDCSATLDVLDARKIAGRPTVRMGILNAYTTVGGGIPSCSRNKVVLRDARCGLPTYFVDITAGGTVTEDNVISDECNFYGTPTVAAVRDKGTRTYIGGYYEHGDVDISGAFQATVNVRLGNGMVIGHTEATGKSVTVNGVRKWPGPNYPAVISTSGVVSYTPDAAVGLVGENKFEHRIAFSAATGITINAATNPTELQELRLEIRNGTGGAITPVFDAVYIGVTASSLGAGNKSVFVFRYQGGKWILISAVQNVTFDGEVIVSCPPSAPMAQI